MSFVWQSKPELDKIADLNKTTHNNGDLHLIGDTLGAPAIILGGAAGVGSVGSSPLAAREDHQHKSSRAIFADLTARNLVTTGWVQGDICYVISNDTEYIWNSTAWKIWNYPCLEASTPYTPVLTGSTTNPTLGTSGSVTGEYCIRARRMIGNARIYWGTTAGAPGSGDYFVTTPYVYDNGIAAMQYCIAGPIMVYSGGIFYMGICRPFNTVDSRLYLNAHGTSLSVGSAQFPGAAGVVYHAHFNLPISEAVA